MIKYLHFKALLPGQAKTIKIEARQGMFFVPPLSCANVGDVDIAQINFVGKEFEDGGAVTLSQKKILL